MLIYALIGGFIGVVFRPGLALSLFLTGLAAGFMSFQLPDLTTLADIALQTVAFAAALFGGSRLGAKSARP